MTSVQEDKRFFHEPVHVLVESTWFIVAQDQNEIQSLVHVQTWLKNAKQKGL